MIERSMERFNLYPARLMGDSAYGSAEMLGWLVHEHGIEPHVTVFDKSASQDGTFSRDDFAYDQARDFYLCPGGKKLTALWGMTMQRCSTAPANTTAQDAPSSSSAALGLRRGRCRAPSTRAHAIWRARSLNPERAGPRSRDAVTAPLLAGVTPSQIPSRLLLP